jgi:phosphatidyl-myo-inositol dimannoside synthase
MSRPRILVLTEDSKPATGGIAEYLHQLAVAVAPTADVHIVTSVPRAARVAAPAGLTYEELPWFRTQLQLPGDRFPLVRKLNTLRWRVGLRGAMRRHLRRLVDPQTIDPQTTVVLGRVSAVTHPWCQACRDLGIPYAAIGYGLELIEPETPREDILGAARWFSISADTTRLLVERGVPADRIVQLPPGVDPRTVESPSEEFRVRVRTLHGLGRSPFVLTIGMFRKRKGMDVLMDAFATISDRFPELRLVIVGDGPEREPLIARRLALPQPVQDRVLFTAPVDDATRNALLAECSVFVLANRRLPGDVEGFGIVFLEAALHGKAAIGGRNGGVSDAIVDGVTGLLVDMEPDPVAAVATALDTLMRDPDRTRAMGQRAYERAATDFRWADRAATFLQDLALQHLTR